MPSLDVKNLIDLSLRFSWVDSQMKRINETDLVHPRLTRGASHEQSVHL